MVNKFPDLGHLTKHRGVQTHRLYLEMTTILKELKSICLIVKEKFMLKT